PALAECLRLEAHDLKQQRSGIVEVIIMGDLFAELELMLVDAADVAAADVAAAAAVGVRPALVDLEPGSAKPVETIAALESGLALDEIERATARLLLVVVPRALFEIDAQ